ncbi:hypothetical protein R6Q57_028056 [Mikania cordata]
MSMGTPRCIDWGVLGDCGEAERARAILGEDTLWTRLFDLAELPSYRLITMDFLSTFRYMAHQAAVRVDEDAELPPDIEFSLYGQHFEMSIERFVVYLGIYYEPETVTDGFAQGLTQGEEGVMRAWWAQISDAPPCNLARCFALYYASFYHRQERGTLWGGAFITHIARTIGMVDMLDDLQAIEPRKLDRRTIISMKLAADIPGLGLRFIGQDGRPFQPPQAIVLPDQQQEEKSRPSPLREQAVDTAARGGGASAASTARLPCGAPDRAARGVAAPNCQTGRRVGPADDTCRATARSSRGSGPVDGRVRAFATGRVTAYTVPGATRTEELVGSTFCKMVISKTNLSRINWCSLKLIASSNVNRVRDLKCNSFCTMIECQKADDDDDDDNSIEVTESPDLPIWVRTIENDSLVTKSLEDEFVLPSVSYWIENYKRGETKEYNKITVGNKDENDMKKIAKVLMKLYESVDSVVLALNDTNVIPSESLVVQMLKRFDNNWKSAYGVFIWAESHMGSKFSPDMYDLLVDCLGKSKKFDLMRLVVKQMLQIGDHYVTINTMAKVIRRFSKAGLHEDAIDEFRRIEQFGVKKDLSAFNILIDALAKEKNAERAHDIFLEFKDEISPNAHTFNSLIHGWSKARDIEKIQTTMEQMKEQGINPDVVSYTSLIEAYCCEKDFRKVDHVLKEMQANRCPPNIITYTILMHARGKSKETDEALKVYEKIKSTNCVLDASFFNSLIFILSKAGRLKDAREVFDEMPDQGVKHDTQTYNTMITSVCEHTQEENALKLLHEMEKCGVKPNFDTYAPLLKMFLKLKRMKVVSFLLSHMQDNNVSVGLGTYSLLVRGFCKNNKLKHACLFLEDAVMRGFVPFDTMFKLLETKLEKEGMTEEMKRIQELKLIQPTINRS